jgi:drug/metabolite transporter (DMT)-like permease
MDLTSFPYIGEILALLAPLCWSFAVILFRVSGRSVSPVPLNFYKNTLSTGLFILTALITGQGLFRGEPVWVYILLIASGVIGIGLADMFFFMTLNRVGAGLQAIINTFYSPSIILLSVVFLHETFTLLQVMGVTMILGAVLAVTRMRGPAGGITGKVLVAGVIYGLLAALTQAVSIVMIKPWLDGWPLFWTNSWRMLGGLVSMAVMLAFMPGGYGRLRELADRSSWLVMTGGAVLGTYVSLIFWLGGMKYTQASTASALNQTATLFTFILAALLLHEPVTWKRLLGLVAGMAGVFLVIFGGAQP